jgi:hypothetical protein
MAAKLKYLITQPLVYVGRCHDEFWHVQLAFDFFFFSNFLFPKTISPKKEHNFL